MPKPLKEAERKENGFPINDFGNDNKAKQALQLHSRNDRQ